MSTTDDAVMRELDKVIVSVDPAAKVEVEDVIQPVMASTVTAVPDTVLELRVWQTRITVNMSVSLCGWCLASYTCETHLF